MEKPHVQTTINQITSNATTKQNKQTNKNTRFTFQKAVQLTIFLHCTSSDNQRSSTEGGYTSTSCYYISVVTSPELSPSVSMFQPTTVVITSFMSHRSQAPSLSCLCRLCGLVSATTEETSLILPVLA